MNFKAPNINDKIKKKKAHKFSEMSKLQVFFRILFFAWFTKFNSYALNIYATTDTFPCINTHWFAHIFDIFHKIKHEKKNQIDQFFALLFQMIIYFISWFSWTLFFRFFLGITVIERTWFRWVLFSLSFFTALLNY